jgi:hypothetical protein
MIELAETRGDAETRRPHPKGGAEHRIDELVRKRQKDRERIGELEHQLSERTQEGERQREAQQKKTAERIAKAREEGRGLFADFDAVITGIPVDRQAFESIIASANGPDVLYAIGLGMRMIGVLRQLHGQTQADRERIEYYRQMHQQHFTGENNGILPPAGT